MIDLHLHLDGSLESGELTELARLSKVSLLTTDENELRHLMTVGETCGSLTEYLEKFALPLQVLQTWPALSRAVSLLLARLERQGLLYAEIRFAPQLHGAKGLSQEDAIRAACEGLAAGCAGRRIRAGLILCCMRGDQTEAANRETVRLAAAYLGKGVCALDLAGDETHYPTALYSDLLRRARLQQVPLTVHAGEAAGADSVREALEIGALRIGHGIRSAEDPAVMERIRKDKIRLELCYSSNLQTGAAAGLEEYPLRRLLESGLCVTINTDNMTVSGTDLRKEYLRVQRDFGLTESQLQSLAEQGARSSFLPEAERERLCEKVRGGFPAWLHGES